ncbi:hypothetical protein FOZ62_004304, partial [Perkinsus olseni]
MRDIIKGNNFPIGVIGELSFILSELQSQYIEVLEENRALRQKQAESQDLRERSFRDVVLAPMSTPSQRPKVTVTPKDNVVFVQKGGAKPTSKEAWERSVATLRGKIIKQVTDLKIPVSRVMARAQDVAVFFPPSVEKTKMVESMNKIACTKCKVPDSLLPEVLIYTGDQEGTQEDFLGQVKAYMGLDTDQWHRAKGNDKFTVYRMSHSDRDKVIKNGGVYINAQKIKAHDYISLRGCMKCGGNHGPTSGCKEEKRCLFCGSDSHDGASCEHRNSRGREDAKCSLCGETGHTFFSGPPCRARIEQIRAKYQKIGYNPSEDSPPLTGPLSR